MDKELRFVAKYYRKGSLDIKRAYKLTLAKAGRRQDIGYRWIAVAAVVVLLIVGGAIVFFRQSEPQETVIAAQDSNRQVTLADGTNVVLAPHSSITFGDDCRNLELSGKAYFDIHHDAEHEFIIHDNDYTIRDIGTRLIVDEKPLANGRKLTSVYVAEGSVSLVANNSSKGVIIDKEEMYQIGSGTVKPLRVSQKPSDNSLTAWATHEFHFDNTPLPTVLDDLSTYYNIRLSCPGGESKRLTADFHTDSLSTIIGMIEETLNVNIKQNK